MRSSLPVELYIESHLLPYSLEFVIPNIMDDNKSTKFVKQRRGCRAIARAQSASAPISSTIFPESCAKRDQTFTEGIDREDGQA